MNAEGKLEMVDADSLPPLMIEGYSYPEGGSPGDPFPDNGQNCGNPTNGQSSGSQNNGHTPFYVNNGGVEEGNPQGDENTDILAIGYQLGEAMGQEIARQLAYRYEPQPNAPPLENLVIPDLIGTQEHPFLIEDGGQNYAENPNYCPPVPFVPDPLMDQLSPHRSNANVVIGVTWGMKIK